MYRVIVVSAESKVLKVFWADEQLSYDQEKAFLAQFPTGCWLDISRIPIDPDEHLDPFDEDFDYDSPWFTD